ncbi:MAG: substrate-binding domain-containing protein, partial [Desulfococcaceae bacterium]
VRAAMATSDIVATVGGSSAGSEDYTKEVIQELGEILVHGVTIMPGKPVLLGRIEGKPFIGMPGYPVSMIVAFEQFVAPLIHRMLGQPEPQRRRIPAETTRKIPSKLGTEEFLRVKLGRVGDRVVATPLPRGAGSFTTITEADGILRVPAASEGMDAHEIVETELLRPEWELDKTLVAAGSHDNALDVLADALKAAPGGFTLGSSHVGSMGGLMALRRGVCHFAGCHLLDTEDGSYNVSYVDRFLKGTPVRIVHLVMRDQGLMVSPGNPKGVEGIESLTRDDVFFINRQSGSGTRILLDYRLGRLGVDPEQIAGYGDEEFTHMAVAAAVASGTADAGLGIQAAAKALKLDFIPVVTEQYDLIIPEAHFETEGIQTLLEIVRDEEFRKRVEALGGYDMGRSGAVLR